MYLMKRGENYININIKLRYKVSLLEDLKDKYKNEPTAYFLFEIAELRRQISYLRKIKSSDRIRKIEEL